jgi:aryl-alcohol dehydrogenase-like predicted oxidoreductase
MKVGLGTVQFGLDYGITNVNGAVSLDEAQKVLAAAWTGGVRVLDTASAYGNSESVLGQLTSNTCCNFRVITKTAPQRVERITSEEIRIWREGFNQSLLRLKTACVDTLLVHDADNLLIPGGDRLYDELLRLIDLKQVKKIGFSAYDARQIDAVIDRYKVSAVQIPLNVFDQRLIQSGTLERLSKLGLEIYARSVFLQGLLLQDSRIPVRFHRWKGFISRYHDFLKSNDIDPISAAIGFVARQPQVNTLLIGVTSCAELSDCLGAYREDVSLNFADFSVADLDLIDPRRWVN